MEKKINEKVQTNIAEESQSASLSEDCSKDSEEKPVQPSWRTRFIKVDEESINRFKSNEFKSNKSLFLLFNVYLLDSSHPVPLLFGTYLHFDQLDKGISFLDAISLLIRENLAVNHSYAIQLCDALDYCDDKWDVSTTLLSNSFYICPLVFEVLGTEQHKMIRLIKWCSSFKTFKEFLKNEI